MRIDPTKQAKIWYNAESAKRPFGFARNEERIREHFAKNPTHTLTIVVDNTTLTQHHWKIIRALQKEIQDTYPGAHLCILDIKVLATDTLRLSPRKKSYVMRGLLGKDTKLDPVVAEQYYMLPSVISMLKAKHLGVTLLAAVSDITRLLETLPGHIYADFDFPVADWSNANLTLTDKQTIMLNWGANGSVWNNFIASVDTTCAVLDITRVAQAAVSQNFKSHRQLYQLYQSTMQKMIDQLTGEKLQYCVDHDIIISESEFIHAKIDNAESLATLFSQQCTKHPDMAGTIQSAQIDLCTLRHTGNIFANCFVNYNAMKDASEYQYHVKLVHDAKTLGCAVTDATQNSDHAWVMSHRTIPATNDKTETLPNTDPWSIIPEGEQWRIQEQCLIQTAPAIKTWLLNMPEEMRVRFFQETQKVTADEFEIHAYIFACNYNQYDGLDLTTPITLENQDLSGLFFDNLPNKLNLTLKNCAIHVPMVDGFANVPSLAALLNTGNRIGESGYLYLIAELKAGFIAEKDIDTVLKIVGPDRLKEVISQETLHHAFPLPLLEALFFSEVTYQNACGIFSGKIDYLRNTTLAKTYLLYIATKRHAAGLDSSALIKLLKQVSPDYNREGELADFFSCYALSNSAIQILEAFLTSDNAPPKKLNQCLTLDNLRCATQHNADFLCNKDSRYRNTVFEAFRQSNKWTLATYRHFFPYLENSTKKTTAITSAITSEIRDALRNWDPRDGVSWDPRDGAISSWDPRDDVIRKIKETLQQWSIDTALLNAIFSITSDSYNLLTLAQTIPKLCFVILTAIISGSDQYEACLQLCCEKLGVHAICAAALCPICPTSVAHTLSQHPTIQKAIEDNSANETFRQFLRKARNVLAAPATTPTPKQCSNNTASFFGSTDNNTSPNFVTNHPSKK